MKEFPGGEDGQTLVLVMVVTTILFILSSVLGAMTLLLYKNVLKQEEFIKAQCAADAGIEKLIAKIKEDDSWLNELPDSNNNGVYTEAFPETHISDSVTYSVDVIKERNDIGNYLLIDSLGQCKDEADDMQAQKTLHCEVAIFGAEDYLKGLAILSDQPSNYSMLDNITVDAIMVLNGSIDIPDTVYISGDVYASGNVTGDCGGQIYSNYSYIPPSPELDENYYLQKAMENGHAYYHDVTFGDSLLPAEALGGVFYDVTASNGFYYVDGDVNIFGNYLGTALIFSTGDINVVGDLETGNAGEENLGTSMGSLTLVSLGDVDIQNYFVCANIITSGTLYARDGASLYGSACVGGLTTYESDAGAGVFIGYNSELRPIDGAVTVNVETKSWKELRAVY